MKKSKLTLIAAIITTFVILVFVNADQNSISGYGDQRDNNQLNLTVIPFENLSPESSYEYISYGIAMSLSIGLDDFVNLNIIPMEAMLESSDESNADFHENALTKLAADELDFIVYGSFNIANDTISINTTLLDSELNEWNITSSAVFPHERLQMETELASLIRNRLIDHYAVIPIIPQCNSIERSLVILIDSSNSMNGFEKINQAKEAAISAISNLGQNTEAAVLAFSGNCNDSRSVRVKHGFTTNHEDLIEPINEITASSNTPLSSALRIAVDYIKDNGKGRWGHIVLLCDGQDDCNNLPDALEYINQINIDITLDAIGFHIEPESQAEIDLTLLSGTLDGRYFTADNYSQLEQAFDETVNSVDFQPTEHVIFMSH